MFFLAEGGDPGFLGTLGVPMILMLVVFWFMMMRPAKREQAAREDMLKNLKKNDHVLTSGGMYGIVDRVGDHEVILKIDEAKGVKIRMARSAIASVIKVAVGGKPDGDAQEEKK